MLIFFLATKIDGPKFPKVSMNFGLSRYSNSIFSEFSGSICCIKISIEFIWSCHKSIDWKVVGLFVSSETWLYQSSKNWFSDWVDWNCKLDILRSYPFGFSHQRVNRKLYICREGIDWEVFNLILVIKYWCPKTHWRFLVLNHLDFQNHVSPLVEAWFLPSRSQSETNILIRRLGWKYVDFLPCNKNWWSEIPKSFHEFWLISIF